MDDQRILAHTLEEELQYWMPAFQEINDYFLNHPYTKVIPKEPARFQSLEHSFGAISDCLTLKAVVYRTDIVTDATNNPLLNEFLGTLSEQPGSVA